MTATAAPLPAPAAPTSAGGFDAQAQLREYAYYTVEWLRAHAADIAIAVAAGAIIYLVLRAARRLVRRAAARHVDQAGFGATALRVLARTRQFFLVMVSVRLVDGYANPPELLAQTIRVLFILAAAIQAAIWARELVMSVVRQRAAQGSNETLGNAMAIINVLVSIALFAIAAIVVLDNVGVNVTGLIAGLGIGGIAIGLAAKGVFEDLFAALAIIFDRPFRTGESIQFGGISGTVERIGLKSTRIRALTGEEIIVSNTNLLNERLSNFARLERRRMHFAIGVTYETPVGKLRAVPTIAREIIEAGGHRLVRCGFVAFGASSLDFELQFDVLSADYDVVFKARHDVGLALIERFAAEGIAFAYPVQVAYTAAPDGTLVTPWPPPEGGLAPAAR